MRNLFLPPGVNDRGGRTGQQKLTTSHRDRQSRDPGPEDYGVESQIRGLAWVLAALIRPVIIGRYRSSASIRAIASKRWQQRCHIPAGQYGGDRRVLARSTDRLDEQHGGHHPGQEHQIPLVANRAFFKQECDRFSMQLGTGYQVDLDWYDSKRSHGSVPS